MEARFGACDEAFKGDLASTLSEPQQLLNHAVGAQQDRLRDFHSQGMRGFSVDDQLHLGRLLDGQLTGFRALENPVDVSSRASACRRYIRYDISPPVSTYSAS